MRSDALSHAGNPGSIPGGITKHKKELADIGCSFFIFCLRIQIKMPWDSNGHNTVHTIRCDPRAFVYELIFHCVVILGL
jgi:hypothetical protein